MASSFLPLLQVPYKGEVLGQHHIRLFTSYEVQHQQPRSLGYDRSPKWTLLGKKRFAAIPSPKRQRRVKFNTKEKNCRSILLYPRWSKASKSMWSFSCGQQRGRGITASHIAAATGRRFNVGTGSHRKTQLPFPDHAVNANVQQAERV